MNKFGIILLGIMGLLGAAAFALYKMPVYIHQLSIERAGFTAEGKITALTGHRLHRSQTLNYYPTVVFTPADGKVYTFEDKEAIYNANIGDEVKVCYEAGQPEKAFLAGDTWKQLLFLGLVVVAVSWVSLLIIYRASKLP